MDGALSSPGMARVCHGGDFLAILGLGEPDEYSH